MSLAVSPPVPIAELGAVTWRFQRTLRHLVARAVAEHDLGLAELGALHTIQALPGVTGAELARHLDVTPQAANQLIQRLDERALLTRAPHPTIARGLAVTLTAEGGRLADAAKQAATTAYADLLAPLDPAEAAALLDALHRCSQATRCHPDPDSHTDPQEIS